MFVENFGPKVQRGPELVGAGVQHLGRLHSDLGSLSGLVAAWLVSRLGKRSTASVILRAP